MPSMPTIPSSSLNEAIIINPKFARAKTLIELDDPSEQEEKDKKDVEYVMIYAKLLFIIHYRKRL